MKFLSALALLFIVQISSASISELHPINPNKGGMNYGNSGEMLERSLMFGTGASSISSDGRFVAYVTVHENTEDSSTVDYIIHRYDRTSSMTLSSNRIMKNSASKSSNKSAFLRMSFEDESAQSVIFTYLSEGFYSAYRYDFISEDVSIYKADIGPMWAISPNGKFFLYGNNGVSYVFDKESNTEISVPTSYSLTNGDIVNFEKSGLLTRHAINDQGVLVLAIDSESGSVEGASQYYQYNINTKKIISFNSLIPAGFDYDINVDIFSSKINLPLVSNNGQYISLPARNSTGALVILLVDTISSNVIEHEVPFELDENGYLMPRLLTDAGIAQYVSLHENKNKIDEGELEIYLYNFKTEKVIERTLLPVDSDLLKFQGRWVDQISLDGSFVVIYDALVKVIPDQINGTTIESSLFLANLSISKRNDVNITPVDAIIDPYLNQASKFSIDISGTDIYGLDVNCNLSSESLSITQANYNGLFGSQNTMTLPLIYSASSITATETLVAPELPFTGTGSFVLADVIADFTTEDVQVICAAEVSDENGQLLQVTLTPATIRIDDGVHGGAGTVFGTIAIPGVTDLAGVEVVLTIDGRQVTVITDETGTFSFDALRDGDFTISLASENYVQSCQVANVAEGGAVDLGSIELLAGDINADGNIDIADFTFMAARYRSNQGDADYDAKADLNKDGTINIQDLAILGSHFGSTQCGF